MIRSLLHHLAHRSDDARAARRGNQRPPLRGTGLPGRLQDPTHATWAGAFTAAARTPLPPAGTDAHEHALVAVYDQGAQDATRRLLGISSTNVTMCVALLEDAAAALREHTPRRNTEQGPITGCGCGQLKWGDGWSEHTAQAVFDALPSVQPRTDHRPPRPLRAVRTPEPDRADGADPYGEGQ